MCYTQSRFKALLSACVLSLIATAGWSQSLTWLGTLGGNWSEAYGVSADGSVVVGRARNAAGFSVPFAGRRLVGCKTSARWAADWSGASGVSADGAVVVGWAQNAAGPQRAFRWTESGDARPRHAGRRVRAMLMVFPPTAPWWSAGLRTPQGRGVPFAGRRWAACKASARWAAVGARLWVFPPTAPWWSAGLKTPQGSIVPFAGRRRVGCKTSARCRAIGARLMLFPPTAPWWSAGLSTPQGSMACLSLDGVWWHARPRHAGRQ
jgi:probable HAF family extracellular repeat protein